MTEVTKIKKALVIEDDSHVAYTLKSILEDQGFTVTHAKNGQQGIDEAKKDKKIDIIFCDIIMPEKDGIAVINEIRSFNKNAYIIAVSGGGRVDKKDYLTIAKNIGANNTLQKPFDFDDVIKVIR